jgi:hypothetical protein
MRLYRVLGIILFSILLGCFVVSNVAATTLEIQVSASKDDAVERPTDGEVWYNRSLTVPQK